MKRQVAYPVIDMKKTGENILFLRERAGLSVNDIREFMGFAEPQPVYQWQRGVCLPSVDHLCALSRILNVSMDEILVLNSPANDEKKIAQRRVSKRISHMVLQHLLSVA